MLNQAMLNEFDIVLVGGSVVGASLALALASAGHNIALVESDASEADEISQWDKRIYAVNLSSRILLEKLLAWPSSCRIGAITTMQVYGDCGGHIAFSQRDAMAPALAWTVENQVLLKILKQRLVQSGVVQIKGARPTSVAIAPTDTTVVLDNGQVLRARLLVGADGADSWVRHAAGISTRVTWYGQSSVVANFACDKPHDNTARQWFFKDSVLAWLPLAGNHISIVWSTPTPQRLLELPNNELATVVAAAGNDVLGKLVTLTPATAFPLRLICPSTIVCDRMVLVGDAAHTVHPLAGQGMNLGLEDVGCLMRLIKLGRDPGEWRLLRQYARERREPIMAMQLFCHGLYTLFAKQQVPGLAWVRNAGLSFTDWLTPLKRRLVRRATGF